jgi:hypothetical protein
MGKTNIQIIRVLAPGLAVFVSLLLPGCSVNVKKATNGDDKQVDINTPVGGIHVSNGAAVADVGLAVYPGARPTQKDSNSEEKSANVNISSFGYGLKVVALEYESEDSPAKLVAFYKDQLRKYGHVLECHTSQLDLDTSHHWDTDHPDRGSNELAGGGTTGSHIELKVGSKVNQHIVAVEPEGRGSKFSLVYVRTHSKDAEI